MSYLLDTPVLSELVRQAPDPDVVSWVDTHDESTLFLSVLTLGELQKGVSKRHDDARKETLQAWLSQDLVRRFAGRVLQVDTAVALAWGVLHGEAERAGTSLPVVDSLIAATAQVYGLTVVTRNVRHLERCGVQVVNPWRS